MEVLALIPARANSKSIKLKNMQILKGKPLIYYTIMSALNSKRITRTIVSSESTKILNYSKNKVEIIKRPKKLSRDNSPTLNVVIHCLRYLKKKENYNPDILVILQPTSPFRKGSDIDTAIKLLEEDKKSDCLVSVQRVPHNFEPYSQMVLNKKGYLKNLIKQKKLKIRKQDKLITYSRNGAAIYVLRRFQNINKILSGNILPFKMSMISSIDIDTKDDLQLCRHLATKIKL
jgi:CMP-N,N'-diacetyllegionaminic acid synthase